MSEQAPTIPNPKLVSLYFGSLALLVEIFPKTQWTTSPKEKTAAGKLKSRIEDLLLSQPDPCLLSRQDPNFAAANHTASKAMREWSHKVQTLELSDLEKQACISCVKHNANEKGGADEFLADLQEVFGITE
jgi:hypothetical protein